MTETVSIIIPTYYRNDFLERAIDSVLRQPYRPIEIIVVDDTGEAHASPIISKYDDLIYLNLPENIGQNAALNRGVQQANGKYIQFLDDDDEVVRDKYGPQIELLQKNTDTGVAYCGVMRDDGTVHHPKTSGRGDVLREALRFNLYPCITSTMLFKSESLRRVLPLPTPLGSTDIYMKIELAQITEFDFVDKPCILKRDTDDSVSMSWAAIEGMARVFDEYRELYSAQEPDVLRSAIASYHYRKGSYYIRNKYWSPRAISSFALAWYNYPGPGPYYLSSLLGSILGRPGKTIAERTMDKVLSLL